MRVEVAGRKDGKRVRQVFDLLDHYDAATHTSSMARTTGYTCTALVRWVAMHGAPMTGIVAPEIMGALPGCFDFVRAHHAERGVHVTRFLFTDE